MNSYQPLAVRPEFSPRSLLRSVWKQRIGLGITWMVISLLALLVARSLPAVYEAETLIQVEEPSVSEKLVPVKAAADPQDRLTALNQQILSYARLLKIIQELDLYRDERRTEPPEEVVAKMRKDLTVKLEKGWNKERTAAFRVSYEGRDPQVAARVANEIGRLFIEGDARTRTVRAAGASDLLETEFARARKTLQRLEERLTSYKVQHTGELPQQEQALAASLGRLQLQLQATQDSVSRTEQTAILLRNSLNSAQATEAALARLAIAETPELPGAAAGPPKPSTRSETVRAELEALRARYNVNHPEIKRLQAEIDRLDRLEPAVSASAPDRTSARGAPAAASRAAAQSAQRAEVLIRGRERVEELQSQLAIAGRQLETLRAERERLLREINALQSRLDKLPVREQELAALTRDYEISKANYQSLLDKKLAANMAAEVEQRQPSETFSVIDPARPPHRPIKPNRPLLGLLGSVLGLGLGMVLAVAKELKNNVLLGEWELPPDVFILGRVPFIGPAGREVRELALAPGNGESPELAISSDVSMASAVGPGADGVGPHLPDRNVRL